MHKSYPHSPTDIALLMEGVDTSKLPYPPMAVTKNGKYFLNPDGEINFVVRVGEKSQSGSANPKEFIKVYQKYFAADIDDASDKKFREFYQKNMTSDVDSESEDPDLPFPKMYKSEKAKWVYSDGQVLYKLQTKDGLKQGTATVDEFAKIYAELKG